MAEGIRIGGGRKPEGKNVWRKYDGYTPSRSGTISFTPMASSGTTAQIQVAVSGELTIADITVNDFVGKTLLTELESGKGRVDFYSNSILYYYDGYGDFSMSFSYTYDASTGIISIPTSSWYAKQFANNTTYQLFAKTIQAIIGSIKGFVVDDDSSAYPDGGTASNGYYYELLGQVSSANVASLSDNTLVAVQADYREQIVSEVSQ